MFGSSRNVTGASRAGGWNIGTVICCCVGNIIGTHSVFLPYHPEANHCVVRQPEFNRQFPCGHYS